MAGTRGRLFRRAFSIKSVVFSTKSSQICFSQELTVLRGHVTSDLDVVPPIKFT